MDQVALSLILPWEPHVARVVGPVASFLPASVRVLLGTGFSTWVFPHFLVAGTSGAYGPQGEVTRPSLSCVFVNIL
jgi:hypothetical protein